MGTFDHLIRAQHKPGAGYWIDGDQSAGAPLLRKFNLRHQRTLPIPCLDRRRFFFEAAGRGGGGGKGVYKKPPITGAAFSSLVGINP